MSLPVSRWRVRLGIGRIVLRHLASASAMLAVFLAVGVPASVSCAKTPGAVHCYGERCHRVSTNAEMQGNVGRRGFLKASYYDDCRVDRFNTCALTSSGEVFRPGAADNAASPIFPDGTVVLAYHPVTKKVAVLRVNSAGPYHSARTLDVSRATAEKLGFRDKGVVELMVGVISSPEPEEARYKKRRRYHRVPGYIGEFASFESAHDAALAGLKMNFSVRMSALDEGDLTPLPPPEELSIDLEAVPIIDLAAASPPVLAGALPQLLQVIDRTEALTALGYVVREELVARPTRHGGAIQRANGWRTDGAEVLDPVSATLAALSSDHNSVMPAPPRHIIQVRENGLGAYFSSGRAWQRVAEFLQAARERARLRGGDAVQRRDLQTETWRARLARFVTEARLRARAGADDRGPLTRPAAELRFKAQRPRYELIQ